MCKYNDKAGQHCNDVRDEDQDKKKKSNLMTMRITDTEQERDQKQESWMTELIQVSQDYYHERQETWNRNLKNCPHASSAYRPRYNLERQEHP